MTAVPSTELAAFSPADARRARWGVGLVFFVNGAAFASWVSRLPALRAGLNLADGTLGSLLFALSVGVLLAFPLAGKGAPLLGSRPLALASGVVALALTPVPFLIGTVPSLALVLFELGAANGAMQISMNVLSVEVQARIPRPVLASLHGLWSAGGLAGAGLGSLAAHAGLPARVHVVVACVVFALVLAVAARLLAGLPSGRPAPVTAPAAPRARRLAGVDRTLAGLGAICFCCFLLEGAMADWDAVFLREHAGASESVAALGYAVFAGAMMTMRLAGDRLVARLPAVRLQQAPIALGAAVLALALLRAQAGVALVAFLALGLGLATIVPSALAAAARHADAVAAARGEPSRAAQAIALVCGCGYTGLLAGPPMIGWLAQATSLRWAMGLLVALAAAIATLAPLLGDSLRAPARARACPQPG